MTRHLLLLIVLFSFCHFILGCASRLPLRDQAGNPIQKEEVEAKRTSKNFALYTIAGGALSFGASFFLGSLLDRSFDKSNKSNSALWITAGLGTAIGTILFAHGGRVRDHNLAVLAVQSDRKTDKADQLAAEQQRRRKIEEEKKRLMRKRLEQEKERKRLLEQLKATKKKKNE